MLHAGSQVSGGYSDQPYERAVQTPVAEKIFDVKLRALAKVEASLATSLQRLDQFGGRLINPAPQPVGDTKAVGNEPVPTLEARLTAQIRSLEMMASLYQRLADELERAV